MYLIHYGLLREPFHVTPDPDFLFLSPGHREALASLICGIDERKGFLCLTGEVGIGKTLIIRSYLERAAGERVRTVLVFNPNLSPAGLLKTIFRELGSAPASEDFAVMLDDLYRLLIAEYNEGRNVAVFIDEAQNMPLETMETLRMLSNLETAKEKLLQIVLVGQPELEERLRLSELRQLAQRIVFRVKIPPLTRKASRDYIAYRIRMARMSGREHPLFTRLAIAMIVRRARGIPRLINVLCTNALITGFGYQKRRISSRIAREVIADLGGGRPAPLLRIIYPLAALLILIGLIAASPFVLGNGITGKSPASQAILLLSKWVSDIGLSAESPARETVEPPRRHATGLGPDSAPDPASHDDGPVYTVVDDDSARQSLLALEMRTQALSEARSREFMQNGLSPESPGQRSGHE